MATLFEIVDDMQELYEMANRSRSRSRSIPGHA